MHRRFDTTTLPIRPLTKASCTAQGDASRNVVHWRRDAAVATAFGDFRAAAKLTGLILTHAYKAGKASRGFSTLAPGHGDIVSINLMGHVHQYLYLGSK